MERVMTKKLPGGVHWGEKSHRPPRGATENCGDGTPMDIKWQKKLEGRFSSEEKSCPGTCGKARATWVSGVLTARMERDSIGKQQKRPYG